nr:mitochondrial mRNA pseudouridine synthase RPUSD3 isoform X2 [Chrysemys picta bellii]
MASCFHNMFPGLRTPGRFPPRGQASVRGRCRAQSREKGGLLGEPGREHRGRGRSVRALPVLQRRPPRPAGPAHALHGGAPAPAPRAGETPGPQQRPGLVPAAPEAGGPGRQAADGPGRGSTLGPAGPRSQQEALGLLEAAVVYRAGPLVAVSKPPGLAVTGTALASCFSPAAPAPRSSSMRSSRSSGEQGVPPPLTGGAGGCAVPTQRGEEGGEANPDPLQGAGRGSGLRPGAAPAHDSLSRPAPGAPDAAAVSCAGRPRVLCPCGHGPRGALSAACGERSAAHTGPGRAAAPQAASHSAAAASPATASPPAPAAAPDSDSHCAAAALLPPDAPSAGTPGGPECAVTGLPPEL